VRVLRSAAACLFLLPVLAPAQVAILQIKVVEGEGVVHAPGSRTLRPITVEITDETGKPVDHAAVSFHLPDDGPGGALLNGLRTDVGMTDANGRVTLQTVQWNHTAGRFQIRIVASREQARAGMLSSQYIGESSARTRTMPSTPSTPKAPDAHTASKGRTKWVVLVALLATGAAVGAVNGSRSTPQAAPQPAASAPVLSIGAATITVGKP
jgi:hypothetical protein